MRWLLPVFLCACAHHAPAQQAPDYRAIAIEPAPPQAELYANCLADAVANHRVAHAHDPDTSLLLFTCEGASARAFFDGLADWSTRVGSEFTRDGQVFRATARVHHDLFGVDYCSQNACIITLNTGEFVH